MAQLHNRFTDEEIKVLLHGYYQGKIKRIEIQEIVEIGITSFFALLKEYHQDPDGFSVAYERTNPAKLSSAVEGEFEKAMLGEKEIAEDPDLPISGYKYTAMRDRLIEKGI